MRREEIRWDRTEQGIGTSAVQSTNPFFENTWEMSLWQKNHRQEAFHLLKNSFPSVSHLLSPSGTEWQKRASWWSLLKRQPKVLNGPDELCEPTVGIIKDSDRRCSSKEFETLNLIASFVSFTESGWGIWRGYTDSWRKDTNLRKRQCFLSALYECLFNVLFAECLNWFLTRCALNESRTKMILTLVTVWMDRTFHSVWFKKVLFEDVRQLKFWHKFLTLFD